MGILAPREYHHSIQDISLAALREQGITLLVLDLDETLIPRETERIPSSTKKWIEEARQSGFSLCIASNNRRPYRVKLISNQLQIPFISLAMKPFPFAFRSIFKRFFAKAKTTAIIGDQLLTDILGGNFLGLYTILVDPMTEETFPPRQLLRRAERWLFKGLHIIR